MEIVIGGPSSLRAIDRLYEENRQRFSNAAQGPEYKELLHTAVLQLVRNWPTEDEANTLKAYIKQLRADVITGEERIAFNGINTVNTLGYKDKYLNSSGDSQADVELFISLYSLRPEGRVFEELAYTEGLTDIVGAIQSIKKR